MTQRGVKNRCESTMHIQHQVSFAAYPAQIGTFVILHAGARAIAGVPPPQHFFLFLIFETTIA
jgi:hypothetical protein